MAIELKIERDYAGPTLVEMESLLSLSDLPVKAKWTNTREEIQIVRRYKDREFVLYVTDLSTLDRTAVTLGIPNQVDIVLRKECLKAALIPTGMHWRGFVDRYGAQVSEGVLLHSVAKAIREGHDPAPLRKVLVQVLLDGVSAHEIDVLLHLRMQAAQKRT